MWARPAVTCWHYRAVFVMRMPSWLLILVVVFNCSCGRPPLPPAKVIQREPWFTQEDASKRPFASRAGTTITLLPSKVSFQVPESWLEWHDQFGNNFHLARNQIDAIARGDGDWDTEFASVCNATLPFDRCSAHVGSEGWGGQSVAFSDLQVRVYELDETVEAVERRITAKGTADIKRFSGRTPAMKQTLDVPWRQTVLSFRCSYGDYGGTAHVDFRLRKLERSTCVFVFMYTNYQAQEPDVASILNSFKLAN